MGGGESSIVDTYFAQALQLFPPQANAIITDESPVLDISSGLAPRFRQYCEDRFDEIDQATPSRPTSTNQDATTSWQLEGHTWDLVAELYS
jgi:hypothetical protein